MAGWRVHAVADTKRRKRQLIRLKLGRKDAPVSRLCRPLRWEWMARDVGSQEGRERAAG